MFDTPSLSGITEYQYWYDAGIQLANRFSDTGDALFDFLVGYDGPASYGWDTSLVLYGPALPPLAGPDISYVIVD